MKEVKYNNIYRLIKSTAGREMLTLKALAKQTGIPYQTLLYRLRNPESIKLCELSIIAKIISFTSGDWEKLRKEIEKL